MFKCRKSFGRRVRSFQGPGNRKRLLPRGGSRGGGIVKTYVDPFDYASEIAKAVGRGVLLTTRNGPTVDSMTIGWGALGIEWGEKVFIAFVREGRFTREQIDATGEFTVNVPLGDFDRRITAYCGSRSGRDTDKASDLGLTLVEPDEVSAPGIRELPLTLECRVLYRQKQDLALLPEAVRREMYPEDVDSSCPMANRDYHVAYYAKIVKSYIIQ